MAVLNALVTVVVMPWMVHPILIGLARGCGQILTFVGDVVVHLVAVFGVKVGTIGIIGIIDNGVVGVCRLMCIVDDHTAVCQYLITWFAKMQLRQSPAL